MKIFLLRAGFLPLLVIGIIGTKAGFEQQWSEGLLDLGRGPAVTYWALLCLLPLYLIRDWQLYHFSHRWLSWLPSSLCLIFFLVMHLQRNRIDTRMQEPVLFRAWTQDIGTDGMSSIEFRRSGIVTLNVVYRFQTDHFEGRYERKGDTLLLDLPEEAGIGSRLVRKEQTLAGLDSSILFNVDHLYEN